MEFNEFREKVKEALPDFLTDDLKNAEIKDTAVNKLQGESYSGISGHTGRKPCRSEHQSGRLLSGLSDRKPVYCRNEQTEQIRL